MAALANLSQFLGIYPDWKELIRKYDVRWASRSPLETFLSILNFDTEDVLTWLIGVVKKLPAKYAIAEAFIALTGMRAGEARTLFRIIADRCLSR